MCAFLRIAASLSLLALFASSRAQAHAQCVPSPAMSKVPPALSVVPLRSGLPDSTLGRFVIRVCDLASNVANGSSVVIDFSGAPGVRLAAAAIMPNTTVMCAAPSVRLFSDIQGLVAFTVVGGGDGASAPGPCIASVSADGVVLARIPVAIYDLDGVGGLGANDLSIWLGDFASGLFHGRCDYDFNGHLGANDLSLWLGQFGAVGPTSSATSYCP